MTQSEFSAKYLMKPEFIEKYQAERGFYGNNESSNSSDLSSEFANETPKIELLKCSKVIPQDIIITI